MTKRSPFLALGFALLLHSTHGLAAILEHRGAPTPEVNIMNTYGVGVATKTGLKTVVPAGWPLYVHRSVTLPETMSWKVGDNWVKVLSEFAAQNKIAVLIDWEKKSVYLRSPEIANEEKITRQEIAAQSTTPLPRLTAEEPRRDTFTLAHNQGPRVVEPQPARAPTATESDALRNVPVIRTNPTPQMVTASSERLQKNPPKLGSTRDFAYSVPVSVNRPPARWIAQAIANRYNLRLVWAAPEVNLVGPVTLLANNPRQDVTLLQKALGVKGPIVLEISESEKVIRALPRHLQNTTDIAAALASAELASVPQGPADNFERFDKGEKAEPASLVSKPKLTLVLAENVPLEDALVRFTRSQGFTLEWRVEGGFEANRTMKFQGHTVAEVLSAVLPDLGLSADIYTKDKHIVVRPGDPALDR
jgi:hypothetical protein